MPSCDLDGDHIAIHTEYRDKDLIRKLPGAKWHAASRTWRAPLSWSTCQALTGIFGDRVSVSEELGAWAAREYSERVLPSWEARERALDPENDTEGDERLRSYQRTGTAFLSIAGSAILADEMGTGKTVQTITALEDLDAFPALVVAPNSVKHVWFKEYEKWAPHRSVQVIHGSANKRRKQLEEPADVYVINWEALRLHSRLAGYGSIKLKRCKDCDKKRGEDIKETKCEVHPRELNRDWAAVVADEAHRAKSPKAKQTRALWSIGDKATHRFALTGTPIADTPDDLWSVLRFVSPEEWPARTRYIDRYCETDWNFWGGMDITGLRESTRAEFWSIVEPRFLRRPKEAVLPHLPPKTYMERRVFLKGKQKKAYKDLSDHMLAQLDNGVLVATDPLTVLGRKTQLSAAYAELDEEGEIRLAEPSAKLDELEEVLAETGDEPVVVFASSRQLIELAEARLLKKEIPCGVISGAVPPEVRGDVIDEFQAGRLKAVLLTYGAGAEGLTLTAASTLVRLQRSWSYIEDQQAEDRVHRPGAEAHDRITIVDIVADGTVDEDQMTTLDGKESRAEEIVRDQETLRRLISK